MSEIDNELSIMDRVKTYEDACEVLGIQPINIEQMRAIGVTESAIALIMIETITKALNEGWELDWDDDQAKYYPWFNLSGGFAFNNCMYASYSYASAGGGSRFCFKSKELAEYAGKQFLGYYEKLLK